MHAYERALQANPNSTAAMNAIGMLLKGREAFDKALEFFRAIVQMEPQNGEAWGNLGKALLLVSAPLSSNTSQAIVTLCQSSCRRRMMRTSKHWSTCATQKYVSKCHIGPVTHTDNGRIPCFGMV